jgi:hypothetical protein
LKKNICNILSDLNRFENINQGEKKIMRVMVISSKLSMKSVLLSFKIKIENTHKILSKSVIKYAKTFQLYGGQFEFQLYLFSDI